MTLSSVARLAVALVCVLAPACALDDAGGACTSAERTSCSGTFKCGNSGISGFCNAATQVCVLKPGSVNCVNIAGASEASCPSEQDALAAGGCGPSAEATCTGSSGAGIVIECSF